MSRNYVTTSRERPIFSWKRPKDWQALPKIKDGGISGLLAIYSNSSNELNLYINSTNGFSIQFQTNEAVNYSSGLVQVVEAFDFDDITAAETSRGYKTLQVNIWPAANSEITSILDYSAIPNDGGNAWLDLLVDCPALTTFSLRNSAFNTTVERIRFSRHAITTASFLFSNHFALQSFYIDVTNLVNVDYMFSQCTSLKELPALIFENAEKADNIFNGCYSLEKVSKIHFPKEDVTLDGAFYNCKKIKSLKELKWDTSGFPSTNSIFYNCVSLTELPLPGNVAFVALSETFQNCHALEKIPNYDFSSVYSIASAPFGSCPNLREFNPTGINQSFSVENCQLSAAALNKIYTNLATVSAKTITVTGNPGTTGDTPTIATSKGWIVTG